ncbi:MAG: ABC transporter permease subunit [Desulfotalea sp.]
MKSINDFFKTFLTAIAPMAFVLIMWSILSLFLDEFILPSPYLVLKELPTLYTDEFLNHLKLSLFRVSVGAALAFLIGTLLAVIGHSLKVRNFAESVLAMGQILPAVVVSIIILLMIGVGSAVPIILIIMMVSPFVAVQTMAALSKKDELMENVITIHGGGKFRKIFDLYLPKLVTTMRGTSILSTTMAVKVCILGEFVGCENGVGFLINVARIYLNMNEVLFYVLVILTMVFTFQILLGVVFKLFLKKYFY